MKQYTFSSYLEFHIKEHSISISALFPVKYIGFSNIILSSSLFSFSFFLLRSNTKPSNPLSNLYSNLSGLDFLLSNNSIDNFGWENE